MTLKTLEKPKIFISRKRLKNDIIRKDVIKEEKTGIRIKMVETEEELDQVYRITHDAYLAKGYCESRSDGKLIHYPHLNNIPHTTIFIAVEDGNVVGTNSFTLDSHYGLHVDDDFKFHVDKLREKKRFLASSWRIVVKEGYRNSRNIVMQLIQATIDMAFKCRIDTCLFTFNPSHEKFYQRLLNMTTIASHDGTIKELKNAPSVFMILDLKDVPQRWMKNEEYIRYQEFLNRA